MLGMAAGHSAVSRIPPCQPAAKTDPLHSEGNKEKNGEQRHTKEGGGAYVHLGTESRPKFPMPIEQHWKIPSGTPEGFPLTPAGGAVLAAPPAEARNLAQHM